MSLRSPITGVNVSSVQAFIDDEVFNYFFARDTPSVLGHTVGARQCLIAQFFEKLHAECRRHAIPAQWEPYNEKTIQQIMDRMNFNDKV